MDAKYFNQEIRLAKPRPRTSSNRYAEALAEQVTASMATGKQPRKKLGFQAFIKRQMEQAKLRRGSTH